jgi:ferrochelatase
LADTLELEADDWSISFQSRLGRKEWVKPYTDETLKQWGSAGVKNVQVICPGFPTDCLETLEEIAQENRKLFIAAGGSEYSYIPALNSSPEHIQMLAKIIKAAR